MVPNDYTEDQQIVAIVSTTRRESLLNISLPSIFNQRRLPDKIYIVADSTEDLPVDQISEMNSTNVPISSTLNIREKNLSGALNTALSEVILDGFNPDQTFVAILDDDDWWEEEYLQSIMEAAFESDADWVISGIIRHESKFDQGKLLSVPDKLEERSFLRGNPHIQGSNLFVRFSKVLLAGGFDENLPSTTDRDVCIRLLSLGDIRVTSVKRHFVHHLAYGDDRLSDCGSKRKCLGLRRFYGKYANLMDNEDKDAFATRSREYFGCSNFEKDHTEYGTGSTIKLPSGDQTRHPDIVIGVIVSDTRNFGEVVRSTIALNHKTGSVVGLVVSDNTGLTDSTEEASRLLSSQGIKLRIITLKEAMRSADRGDLGEYYVNEENRIGIAFGRTVLHRFMYLECLSHPDPVAWIIDDDVSLDRTYWGTFEREVTGREILGLMEAWKTGGVKIVVGKVGGDPPVPVMSTVRTQMVDFYYKLKITLISEEQASNFADHFGEHSAAKEMPGYFYDFPESSFKHLETPIWTETSSIPGPFNLNLEKLSKDAGLIFRKGVFRPALYGTPNGRTGDVYFSHSSNEFGPVRGGNTLILDIESLREFVNSAPRSNDIAYRRGDTMWVTLNKRLGSRRPDRSLKFIVSSPLMLIQDRNSEESFDVMRSKLVADTLGSAFVRALDKVLFDKCGKGQPYEDYYAPLNFTESELENLFKLMNEEINKRVRQIYLNSWRIRGLSQSIRKMVEKATLDSNITRNKLHKEFKEILRICDRVESLYNRKEIENLVESVRKYDRQEIIKFVHQLAPSSRQFADALPIYYSEGEIQDIMGMIRSNFNSGNLEKIGEGKEGLVFSDGVHSYKYFHYGKFGLNSKTIEFLEDKILERKFTGLAELLEIHKDGEHIILKEEHVTGETYNGGRLKQIVSLLRECKSNSIVIRNIAPKNLKVNSTTMKFVDIGRDIVPFTEAGFLKMCKRAYLTYMWHFRSDIHELLHRSNDDSYFPELYGFDYFPGMINDQYTSEISLPLVMDHMPNIPQARVLDFGCGKGEIADALSRTMDVSIYDPDMSDFYKKHAHENPLRVLKKGDLDIILEEEEKFDSILVSLVMCTVRDDEARSILSDVRRLIRKNGELVIVICNPLNIDNRETSTHVKMGALGKYHSHFTFEKMIKTTKNTRMEYHRPLEWYTNELKKAGFKTTQFAESSGTSFETLSPGSEFLLIKAKPTEVPEEYDVSLMIKASPMEWRSIGFQVRHIVKQLEGPEKFKEKFIVTDRSVANFSRQYDTANLELFNRELEELLNEGVIDKVYFAPEDIASALGLSQRWFDLESPEFNSVNGQPTLMTLYGFEQARSKYILQLDSDSIILRDDDVTSYLNAMIDVLENDADAVTASFPVYTKIKVPFTSGNAVEKWRTEVRNCIVNRDRLLSIRPLPNRLNSDGKLELPWHRALDRKIALAPWRSYRGSLGNGCFIHVPNSLKTDLNYWYNVVKNFEESLPPDDQLKEVNLQATSLGEIVEQRNEDVVVLVKGRNTPLPKLRRCFKSLQEQEYQEFGIIFVDPASENGTNEYVRYIAQEAFGKRLSLFRNYKLLTSMENIYTAIREFCTNKQSIIVMLDADDTLIGSDVLSKVTEKYHNGADLTVGTMLRTDKYKEYPVNFDEPRLHRGGNVWQHLRTFRKHLFDAIDPEDFKINGKWIDEADDWAYMLPMVELAEKPEVITDTVYFYEPSPEKSSRDGTSYENTIGKIVSKKSYLEVVKQ